MHISQKLLKSSNNEFGIPNLKIQYVGRFHQLTYLMIKNHGYYRMADIINNNLEDVHFLMRTFTKPTVILAKFSPKWGSNHYNIRVLFQLWFNKISLISKFINLPAFGIFLELYGSHGDPSQKIIKYQSGFGSLFNFVIKDLVPIPTFYLLNWK